MAAKIRGMKRATRAEMADLIGQLAQVRLPEDEAAILTIIAQAKALIPCTCDDCRREWRKKVEEY